VRVDLCADVLGYLALEQLRDAAGEFDDLDAARNLAECVAVRLAVLGRNLCGQNVLIRFEQFAELEHHARTFERRRQRP
jgi:hypothetical protein